jgi:hypothetical protein
MDHRTPARLQAALISRVSRRLCIRVGDHGSTAYGRER